MTDTHHLAAPFEQSRVHLRTVAYRMLGSRGEADDAVQEAWLRLSRADTSAVENMKGWLTTVVARVCLDMLRSRKARREEFVGEDVPEPRAQADEMASPEDEALLADSVGAALLTVLGTLDPAERVAFVLHDLFGVEFDDIAPIVSRTTVATRQLASRARRRVQGRDAHGAIDRERQRAVVEAFLQASRGGDFEALLAVLDPEVVLRVDAAGVRAAAERAAHGAPALASEIRGARAVATTFAGVRGARPAVIDGEFGAVWAPGGVPRTVFKMQVADGKVVAIDIVADPEAVSAFDIELVRA